MSGVPHTATELINAVGAAYSSIDIRAVAIRKDDSWVNVMAVVRVTYEDVDGARTRLAKHAERFLAVKTDSLRIDTFVRPFSEWPVLCLEVKDKGILKLGDGFGFQLRQTPDLSRATGNIQWNNFSHVRSFDGRPWPNLTICFGVPGNSPLEGQHDQAAHFLGYGDALDAANALCEVSVNQQNPGFDLSVSLPVFADISYVRANTPKKCIEVGIQRHRSLPDWKVNACVRGETVLANGPFRAQLPLSHFQADDTGGIIVSAEGSVLVQDLEPEDDWIEIRLVHPRLGEIKNHSNSARMLIPPSERNILLETLQYFCRGAKLNDLLVHAYNEQPKKLKQSAAFELHVSWLLSMFRLSPVVLGEYEHILAPDSQVRRASVDILAASQERRLLLIVGCTLDTPKPEDANNLRYAREILVRDVFAGTGVNIVPVLFNSSMGGPLYDKSEEHFDWVPIVDADSMKLLLEHLRTGQEGHFFQFLSNPTYGLTASSQPR
jgi:hypothetical protein